MDNTPLTRLDFFNAFPEPYKSQAIAAQQAEDKEDEYECLHDECSNARNALDGFNWQSTPQGHTYWKLFNNTL